MTNQFVRPPANRIRRAFAGGVVLLLTAAAGWVFIEAHAPTVSNALTASWVLKPPAYDIFRFACAALAILGAASLLNALLLALQTPQPPASITSPPPTATALHTPVKAPPPDLEDPGPQRATSSRRAPVLRGVGLVALGAAITIAAVLVVGRGDTDQPATEPPVEAETPSSADAAAGGTPYVDAGQAQTNVRLAFNAMESCFTDTRDFGLCDSAAELTDQLGDFDIADEPGPGQTALHGDGDTLGITSADSDGQMWSLEKNGGGTVKRTCLVAVEFTPCDTPSW